MITYTCDKCEYTSEGENIHTVKVPHHIVHSDTCGYIDGLNQPISGITVTYHLCSKCNNEAQTIIHKFITDS